MVAALVAGVVGIAAVIVGWGLNERTRNRITQGEIDRRRGDFQRATMLELQDVIGDLARASYRIHHGDLMNAQAGRPWGSELVPDDAAESSRALIQLGHKLVSRLEDVEIRETCERLLLYASDVGAAENEAESLETVNAVGELAMSLTDQLGERARNLA